MTQVMPDGVMGTLTNPIIVGKRVIVIERSFPASSSRVIALEAP
jgi:hypothetical protein